MPQPGQVVQKLGSGTAQPAHNGASRVPARTASHCRQREHRIHGAGARATPRLSGGLGHHAGRRPCTDAAGRGHAGHAAGADRPLGTARVDPLPALAADAHLQVERVTDEAVRTQRAPLRIPGRRFADRSAAGAGHGVGASAAVATDPQPVTALAQGDHASAAWAGRRLDAGGTGVAERVDQPQHHGERRFRPGPGEKLRCSLDGPRQLLGVGGLAERWS